MESSPPSPRIFSSQDADPDLVHNLSFAVLGYGHLGRPMALNLRDSGVSRLQVGNIEDPYADQARKDGFEVFPIAEAVAAADVILALLPDEVLPDLFESLITPQLAPKSSIVLASGYTLAYGLIDPPEHVDLLLMAPRMAGENARERFIRQKGFYAYVSVEQDASGQAWARLLTLANAVGILNAGAMELSARQEADLDLFIEQSLGTVLGVAIMTAFDIGKDAGLPPEAMVMEMYMSEEMEMVWRAFRQEGFFKASQSHGPTALFGGFIRSLDMLSSGLSETFRNTLEDIRSGGFATRFQEERKAGYPMLTQAEAMGSAQNPIANAEDRLRRGLAEAQKERKR